MKRQEIFETIQAMVAEELKIACKEVDCDFPLLEKYAHHTLRHLINPFGNFQ